jgi:hypothetical protein
MHIKVNEARKMARSLRGRKLSALDSCQADALFVNSAVRLGDHSHSRGTARTCGDRMNIGYWLHHASKLNLSLNRVFGN